MKKQEGFTILELLLYASILGIIVLMVSLFVSLILSSRVKNQTIAEVEQQGVQVIQLLSQQIRNATAVNSPAAGATANALSINIASGNPTVYALNGSTLQIAEGGNPAVAISNPRVTVSNLQFKNLGGSGTKGSISFIFTITYANNSGRNEYSFTKTFYGTASPRY